jgi:hypothetical protein
MARKPLANVETYFGTYGAILRDYKPFYKYSDVINAATGQPELDATGRKKTVKTDEQLGMTAVVVSPLLGFTHISVKIAGDTGTFEHPDIDEGFDSGVYTYVVFDDFKGGSYDRDGTTYYTGTASKIRVVEAPQAAVLSKKPAAAGKTKATVTANPFNS